MILVLVARFAKSILRGLYRFVRTLYRPVAVRNGTIYDLLDFSVSGIRGHANS